MRLRRAGLLAACLLVAAAGLSSCGKDTAEAKNCRTAKGGALTLVAKNVQWDASCLNATPGDLRFTIRNEEEVQHNLRVSGNGLNEHTDLENGPNVQHLAVKVASGTYIYVCDIHANMEGKLFVK